jgi:hypothetical protein
MDSLAHLENGHFAGLIWDERWLLYYWQESYGNFFEEVVHFDEKFRQTQADKTQPPGDSLFDRIDQTLYDRRYDLFQNINHAFLNQEERLFATLALEYLLRLNTNKAEWNAKVASFLKRYPNSRFANFLNSTEQSVLKAGHQALMFDVLFTSGNWQGRIDRYVNPVFAADFGLTWWSKRLNIGARFCIGGPNVAKDLYYAGATWPKGARSSFFQVDLEAGYDVWNKQRLRVTPSLGAGWTFLKAPGPDSESGYNPPDYYERFDFSKPHLLAALTTDVKFPIKNYEAFGVPPGSYNGFRLRVGYRKMFLGDKTYQLQGDLFFVSVGYCLFVYGPDLLN